jgi:hypothetical protein
MLTTPQPGNRRHFLATQAGFLGLVGLSQLLAGEQAKGKSTHFPAKAKRCIFIFLAGGISQVDLFDPKPALNNLHGKSIPESMTKVKFAFTDPKKSFLMRSPYQFQKHGKSGLDISDRLPQIASCADDIAIIRSMHHNSFAHAQAELFSLTGRETAGHPTNGAWLSYGLGSMNDELPAYVTLITQAAPVSRSLTWGSGYLPAQHAGVLLREQGDAMHNLAHPDGVTFEQRRRQIDTLQALDKLHHQETGDDTILERLKNYELAFQMQRSALTLNKFDDEKPSTLEAYGTNRHYDEESFSRNCLLARRLVERGVRFVSIMHRQWDTHKDHYEIYPSLCRQIDQPIAALLKDLKQRGLLDSTLVVFASEFGRTPFTQNSLPEAHAGRDHHPFAYSLWMAGGGVKGGQQYGETDDFGWNITRDPVHLHDFHATMLHLFGMDHTRLTAKHQGLNHRLTDQAGKVIHPLIA